MNVFSKITWQNMRKARTRTAVTIVGVVLSTALVTAVACIGVSLLGYMADGAAQKYGDWQVAFTDVDSAFVKTCKDDERVASAVAVKNIASVEQIDSDDPEESSLVSVVGFTREAFDVLPVNLLSGRLPQNGDEAAVCGHVTDDRGVPYAVGDMLVVDESVYDIVGTCQTPSFVEDPESGSTIITMENATEMTGSYNLFVSLCDPCQVHSYADSVAKGQGHYFNNDVLRFTGLSDNPADALFNKLLYTIIGVVVIIVMIGSIFLIYNSFNISLTERMHQFGILASVGATARQLRNSVLFEGLCIAALGIPIGILVGIGCTALVIPLVATNFTSILYTGVPLTLRVSALAIVLAAAVSMVTILVSAYIPARKAASMPVMECIRQTNEIKLDSKEVRISKLSQRIYGLEGILALKNFQRNKKRYRSIVLSLVLSVVLFVSTSAFVTDLRQVSGQATEMTTYDIGFGTQDMSDAEMLQLFDRLKTVDGVYESSFQVVSNYICSVNAADLSDKFRETIELSSNDKTTDIPVEIQFIDDETYVRILEACDLPKMNAADSDVPVLAVGKMLEGVDVAVDASGLDDMFVHENVHASVTPEIGGTAQAEATGTIDMRLVEIVLPDMPPATDVASHEAYSLSIVAPYSLKVRFASEGVDADTVVKGLTFRSSAPTQSTADMRSIIEDTDINAPYILLSPSMILEENENYVFITNVFAYLFIIMISLIAIANVFNTISTNIRLRRRELAMLRSVGMSERSFNKMMRFECAFYGMRALLIGLPLAVIASWLIYEGMFIGGADGAVFTLPWTSIGISIASVLLVIFVTMMYAASKIRKENIIDALCDDIA